MKKLLCALLALALAASMVTGCGKKAESDGESDGTGNSSLSEQETEEREIVVYSALSEDVTRAAVEGYEALTGVPVRVISDSTSRLISNIGTGTGPQADVLFGAGAEVVAQCAELFTPYVTGEAAVLDERFTSADGLYTGLTPMPIVIMYNKKLTTKAPEGWETLAGEAYRGGVAFANPENSGTAYTALCGMAASMGENGDANYDYVEQFAANLDGELMEGISDVYSAVAAGKFAAGVTLESSVHKYMNAGYDETVGIAYPKEGTPVALEVTALVKGGGSPDDAKAFIDYVSSSEFQGTLVEKFGLRTVRTDTVDPRFCTEKKEITFSALTPGAAFAMREELLPRFVAGTQSKASSTAEASGGSAASSSSASA